MAAPTFPESLGPNRGTIPLAAKGDNATIFSSALTANWQASDVIDLGRAGRLALAVHYDADASGTANQLELCVWVSNAASAPVVADDEWVVPNDGDTSPTATVQADSFPAGADMTATPEWGLRKIRPGYWQTEPSDAGTDKIRVGLVLDVRAWKYAVVMAKEVGDTDAGDLGALTLKAALSA